MTSTEPVYVTVTYGGSTGPKGDTGPNGDLAWQDDWASDHGTYYANDFVYHAVSGHGKGLFRCILEHDPAVAATEPVVGGSAATYWETSIGGGADGAGGDMESDGSVAMTGALTMTQISTPDEPGASKTAIYPKSDGKVYIFSNGGIETEIGSGAAFWTDMPGTPTRASDTQFTITDTSNANKYDKVFTKGTILQWTETATFCTGMIISAAYDSNTVTVNLVGDSLSVGFTAMKYCIHRAQSFDWIVPGYTVVGTAQGRAHFADCDLIKLSVDARVITAGTTNTTDVDINDDNSTIITTKPAIASTATSDLDNVCDAPTTVIAKDSILTLDIDAISTTPAFDLYVRLWVYPEAWRYIE